MNTVTPLDFKKLTLTKLRQFGCYVSLFLVIGSVLGLGLNGLNAGTDFTGGYVTEFVTSESMQQQDIAAELTPLFSEPIRVNSSENGTRWTVRQPDTANALDSQAWLQHLSTSRGVEITPLDTIYIGSQVGDELRDQGGLALLVAAIAIMLYLWMRFEWRLATGSLLALVHDVLIVLGIFAWLQISFDLTVLAAILAIIGYSLNDSIVVGDRIRELLMLGKNRPVHESIDSAIKSTWSRTLITSGTTLVTISAIWTLAGPPLQGFAIALFVGVIVGSFSSVTLSATLPQLLDLNESHYVPSEELKEERLP